MSIKRILFLIISYICFSIILIVDRIYFYNDYFIIPAFTSIRIVCFLIFSIICLITVILLAIKTILEEKNNKYSKYEPILTKTIKFTLAFVIILIISYLTSNLFDKINEEIDFFKEVKNENLDFRDYFQIKTLILSNFINTNGKIFSTEFINSEKKCDRLFKDICEKGDLEIYADCNYYLLRKINGKWIMVSKNERKGDCMILF